VSQHMTRQVLTARPIEEVRVVARRMARAALRQLPVVDDSGLVGIIARRDILEIYAVPDEVLEKRVVRFLEDCAFLPPEAFITVRVDEGIVQLTGTVANESDVRIAGALVASVDGVVDVDNHMVPSSKSRQDVA
jgi:CBS domain-containing protein